MNWNESFLISNNESLESTHFHSFSEIITLNKDIVYNQEREIAQMKNMLN